MSFAAFQLLTRRLMTSEAPLVALFYICVGAFFWSSLIVVFVWGPIDWVQAGIFLLIGTLGVAAHLCIVKAFQAAEASVIAPFNYVKLIWVTALGYILFGEFPASHVLLGGAIITATGLYVLWREHIRSGERR